MIEIISGTLEERIIKLLQRIYPITVNDISNNLKLSKNVTLRTLKKLQMKGVLVLEPLPDKIFVRLLRNNFSFISKKHQKKFLKNNKDKKKGSSKYDEIMYS